MHCTIIPFCDGWYLPSIDVQGHCLLYQTVPVSDSLTPRPVGTKVYIGMTAVVALIQQSVPFET